MRWKLLIVLMLGGAACGREAPTESTEDRARRIQAALDALREPVVTAPVATGQKVYQLVFINQTSSTCIEIMAAPEYRKDLLLGEDLGPNQSIGYASPTRIRAIRARWNDNTTTMHSVPEDGVVVFTRVSWQGQNVVIVEG